MAITFGMQNNIPSEANIPINTWNFLLVGQTPLFWFVTLGDPRGRQFKLWKDRSLNVNPSVLPVIGEPIGLSISTADAQQAGLLPFPDAAPPQGSGQETAAEQIAAEIAAEHPG